MSVVGRWLSYSYRRRLLDRDLQALSERFVGKVLEVGGTRARRGRFSPEGCQNVQSWTILNKDPHAQPDLLANAEKMPIETGSFDTLVCTEVLEYVDEPALFLGEISRVMRPGGVLILSLPFLHRFDSPEDRWRFGPAALEELSHRAGLSVESLTAQGGWLASLAHLAKSGLHLQATGRLGKILTALAYPFLEGLFWMDRFVLNSSGGGWTTGYILVAKKR